MSANPPGPSIDCTILLVRHAHVEMAGRFCGSSDPSLSERGREQAARLAQELAGYPLTRIFSSNLLRAQETAKYIADQAGLHVELSPSLREMHFGAWEGLNWDEVVARDRFFAERWMAEYPQLSPPGAEGFTQFRERVRNSLAKVAARTAGGCAVVVTHGGVIRMLMLDVLHLPENKLASIPCDYASYRELQMQSGECCLKAAGLHGVQTNSPDTADSD